MKVFKPTFVFLGINREKWLRDMSLSGWKLVGFSNFVYKFEKANPEDIYFYIYDMSTRNKNLSWLYHEIKTKYSYKKSRIEDKGFISILPIKAHRIDEKFWSYMNLRDKYLFRETVSGFILFLVLSIISLFADGLLKILFLLFFGSLLMFYTFGLVNCIKHNKTKEYRFENNDMQRILDDKKREKVELKKY